MKTVFKLCPKDKLEFDNREEGGKKKFSAKRMQCAKA